MVDCSQSPSQGGANDRLQPALVFISGCSVSDGDGGDKDGLSDGGLEVHRSSSSGPSLSRG